MSSSSDSDSKTSILDYPGAVDRITDKELDTDSYSKDDVIDDLIESDHVPRDIAEQIAEGGVATTEGVQSTLEDEGEIPSIADIQSAVEGGTLTGVSDSSRTEQIIADLNDSYVTEDDVTDITTEVQSGIDGDGVVTQDDVEAKVNELTSAGNATIDPETGEVNTSGGKQIVGADSSEVTDVVTGRVQSSLPTQGEINKSTQDVIEFDSGQTPRDVVGDEVTELETVGPAIADDSFGAVRNDDGEVEAVVTGNEAAGQAVADELDADYASLGEVRDSFDVEQDRSGTRVTYNGETVREL